MQIQHSLYQNFPPSPLLATNAFHDSNAKMTFLLSIFSPPPFWQLMLFMTQMQKLHLFYQKHFPPSPSWQLMLFMTQMQILHSFYQNFLPPSWKLMLFMTQMQI